MDSQWKGPQFTRFFQPVLDALRQLGGSGRPDEVVEIIEETLNISDDEKSETTTSGESRFIKNVNWARFYLVKSGYLDASTRGVWSLTEQGRIAQISNDEALRISTEIHNRYVSDKKPKKVKQNTVETIELEPVSPEDIDHRTVLMGLMKELPADGFERLCQRLLREAGFEKVMVTGRSGDGGIDGIGLLQVNPFVSFKVLFQCKRYSGAVSSPNVRDFRGAMQGRADKGIILTTGTFTSDARNEASRDGVPPIELVDGEKLLDMFEQLELGLRPIKAYEVDAKFFEEFR